ncbi:hypothetical protein [Paenibacillus sp. 598K]|uniref:hypothetical protein n=1 Tax=Paenibacillus sp. 598K TaxID=1117987 RepID=UPI000FFE88DE|nr:hypothetical protein [Paenibacillus sp. 598K]
MKRIVIFIVAAILCVLSFLWGSNYKENEMHNQEIKNLLLSQHQLLSLIMNDIEQKKSNDYVKGQIITLQYSGLYFEKSHADIKGFMDYCLVAIEEQNDNGLKEAIHQAVRITEALRLDSTRSEVKNVLKQYNQFLSKYPFPAISSN